MLERIWHEKPETASRVRQRLNTVFDYCIVAGWRQDANPCLTLGAALPRRRRTRRHHPALPYTEVSDALAAFRVAPGTRELRGRDHVPRADGGASRGSPPCDVGRDRP